MASSIVAGNYRVLWPLRVFVLGPVLWFAIPAMAQEEPDTDPLTYFFMSADYTFTNPSSGPDAEGYGLSGSTPLSDHFNVFGSYQEVETERFTAPEGTGFVASTSYSAGIGWHTSLSPIADFGLSLSYIRSKARGREEFRSLGEQTQDGFGIGASMRSWVRRGLEFSAGGGVQTIDSQSTTGLSLGLTWNFTKSFAAGAAFSVGSESTGWSGGLRYTLG